MLLTVLEKRNITQTDHLPEKTSGRRHMYKLETKVHIGGPIREEDTMKLWDILVDRNYQPPRIPSHAKDFIDLLRMCEEKIVPYKFSLRVDVDIEETEMKKFLDEHSIEYKIIKPHTEDGFGIMARMIDGRTVRYATDHGVPTMSVHDIREAIDCGRLNTALAELERANEPVTQVYVTQSRREHMQVMREIHERRKKNT